MEAKRLSTFRKRANSFVHAFRGLGYLLLREPNTRIHLIATILVIIAGFIKNITTGQWILITIAIGVVWIAEAFNTAIELLCDLVVGDQYNKLVKIIKDVAAGGVLIAAMVSVVIGVIVFIAG